MELLLLFHILLVLDLLGRAKFTKLLLLLVGLLLEKSELLLCSNTAYQRGAIGRLNFDLGQGLDVGLSRLLFRHLIQKRRVHFGRRRHVFISCSRHELKIKG